MWDRCKNVRPFETSKKFFRQILFKYVLEYLNNVFWWKLPTWIFYFSLKLYDTCSLENTSKTNYKVLAPILIANIWLTTIVRPYFRSYNKTRVSYAFYCQNKNTRIIRKNTLASTISVGLSIGVLCKSCLLLTFAWRHIVTPLKIVVVINLLNSRVKS